MSLLPLLMMSGGGMGAEGASSLLPLLLLGQGKKYTSGVGVGTDTSQSNLELSF